MRVDEKLSEVLGPALAGRVDPRRRRCLFQCAAALVVAGQLTLSSVGRSLATLFGTMEKHAIKRVDRLLGNGHLHEEFVHYQRALVGAMVSESAPLIVLVDWTQVVDDFHALSASVPVDGRAISIYWEVHPKKFVGNRYVHDRFLEALRDRLPDGQRVIVVTDAGFHVTWFKKVRSMGWHFVGRLSRSIGVLSSGAKHWRRADHFWSKARFGNAICLGRCTISQDRKLSARLVLFKAKRKGRKGHRGRNRVGVHPAMHSYQSYQRRHRNPWLLATSLEEVDARQIVGLYAQRMQCEETFRDFKSHRFGFSLEDFYTRSAQRAAIAILLATIAHFITTLIGIRAERTGLHMQFQANTTRRRRVLSLPYLGRRICRTPLTRPLARVFAHLASRDFAYSLTVPKPWPACGDP